MARYAAYKGTRAGALNRASARAMETAALAAWMPMVGQTAAPAFYNVRGSGPYAAAWGQASGNFQDGARTVEVTICNPLSTQMSETDDFDDPRVGSGAESWKGFTRSRLHAQFTFNYRLVIPFANGVIWYAALGSSLHDKRELMKLLRMDRGVPTGNDRGSQAIQSLRGLAEQGKYFLPIRTNYAMRMQSNIAAGALPGTNKCKIPWAKQAGSGT